MIVSVAKVRIACVFKREHAVELLPYLDLYPMRDLIKKYRFFLGAFAADEEHSPLHVVALLERRVGLSGDAPGGGNAQVRCPENHRQVGPDGCVMMCEHDHL